MDGRWDVIGCGGGALVWWAVSVATGGLTSWWSRFAEWRGDAKFVGRGTAVVGVWMRLSGLQVDEGPRMLWDVGWGSAGVVRVERVTLAGPGAPKGVFSGGASGGSGGVGCGSGPVPWWVVGVLVRRVCFF